jgi:hypothetical protein
MKLLNLLLTLLLLMYSFELWMRYSSEIIGGWELLAAYVGGVVTFFR